MQILAEDKSFLCFKSPMSEGFKRHSESSRFSILVRISAAAALVKVTIKSLSALIGFSLSLKSLTTLSTSTAVLPDPAAAETSTLPFVSIADFCSGVGLNATCLFLPYFIYNLVVFIVRHPVARGVFPAADRRIIAVFAGRRFPAVKRAYGYIPA